jgi:hypothetical protein
MQRAMNLAVRILLGRRLGLLFAWLQSRVTFEMLPVSVNGPSKAVHGLGTLETARTDKAVE